MAVKVVNPEPAKEVIKEIVCRNCGVTLSYVPNDVQSRNGRDYSGGPDGSEWIDCPKCKKQVTIQSW